MKKTHLYGLMLAALSSLAFIPAQAAGTHNKDGKGLSILNVASGSSPILCSFNSMMSCTLTLYISGGPGSGLITIQNNYPYTLTNIQANLSSVSSYGVGQDPSNCTSVPPMGTCQLLISEGGVPLPAVVILITGQLNGQTITSGSFILQVI